MKELDAIKNHDFLPHPQNGEVHPRVGPNTELSASELMTLSCGVIFQHIKCYYEFMKRGDFI